MKLVPFTISLKTGGLYITDEDSLMYEPNSVPRAPVKVKEFRGRTFVRSTVGPYVCIIRMPL